MYAHLKNWCNKRQNARKTRLRKRNAQLREAGKEPLKGWGNMVNTGFGGINKTDVINTGKLDNTDFRKSQAQDIGKKNSKK